MPKRNDLNPEERVIMSEYHNGRAYQAWLMSMVNMYDHRKLFQILYETEFKWIHPFDENRAEDGIYLRYRFTQDESDTPGRQHHSHVYKHSMSDFPCSILEMLIALSISIEDNIMYDPDLGDRTLEWFWIMLDNLELSCYDDLLFKQLDKNTSRSACAAIRATLYVFMDREYDSHGRGGLFPLSESRFDQREQEIWYQANTYMIEELGL